MNETNLPAQFKVTEIDLVYRNDTKPEDRHWIDSADLAYKVFMSAWDMNKIELTEQFMIMLFDAGSHCIGVSLISTAMATAYSVDPKHVFAIALKAGATSIALAHNDISGNLEPNDRDINFTGRIRDGGEVLNIEIRDLMIVSEYGYYSMSDEKLYKPQ